MKKISVSLLALTLLTSGCGGDKKAPSPSVAESPEPPPYVLVGTQEYCDPQDGVVIRANIYSDDGGKTTTRSGIESLGKLCEPKKFKDGVIRPIATAK